MLLRPKGRSHRHLAVALHGPRFLPALWDPLPQLPLCFRDLSCCSSWGGKHIFRFNTRSALALSMYTRQFRFMSIWIKEKEKKKKKKLFEMLAESLKGKLVYCLGRRIPVVHILRFPALKPWYIFADLSPASLPGMCKYIWNERNDQKKCFSGGKKYICPHCECETSPESFFLYFFGGVLFFCLLPIEKNLSQYVVVVFISDSMYKWKICICLSLSTYLT